MFMGSGDFPEDLRSTLLAEGVVVMDEDRRGSITYRHYRAPGRRYGWRKVGMKGAVAVTAERVVVWGARGLQIDVPLRAPLIHALEPSVEEPDRLVIAYDANAFHPDRSGRVEVRLRTAEAGRVAELLQSAATTSPQVPT
jgi:hypothetical protein